MKMGGKVFRNAPGNEELSSPRFIMSPLLVKKTSIQGQPGGKQCCFWRDSDKIPTPIPSCLHKGRGGGIRTYSEDQKGYKIDLRLRQVRKIFKRHGCQPTPISKPSSLRRREMNVAGRAAIDSANTTEEILNVNETNPVTEKETEPAENTEILVKSIGAVENSITT